MLGIIAKPGIYYSLDSKAHFTSVWLVHSIDNFVYSFDDVRIPTFAKTPRKRVLAVAFYHHSAGPITRDII